RRPQRAARIAPAPSGAPPASAASALAQQWRRTPMTAAKPRPRILSSPRRRAAHVPLEQRARPTAERMRRAGAHFARGDTGQITMRDSPIERALTGKVITPEQYAAAQKYRHHWYYGGLHDHLASLDLTRIFSADHGSASGMARNENQAF